MRNYKAAISAVFLLLLGIFVMGQGTFPGLNQLITLEPNIAALRANAYASYAFPVMRVAGYSTAADGGEGFFDYIPSDTTSADNGCTIFVDAAGHRYYRERGGGALSVAWCGANTSLADNTTAFQAAINVAQSGYWGQLIFVPAGIYPSNVAYNFTTCSGGTTLSIATGLISFVGANSQTALNFNNGACDDFKIGYQSGTATDIILQNLFISSATFGKTGGAVFDIKNANKVVIRNVTMNYPYNGVYFEGGDGLVMDGAFAQNPTGAYGYKLYGDPATAESTFDITWINKSGVSCNYNPGTDGVLIVGFVESFRMIGTQLLSCRYDLRITNAAGSNTYFPQFGEFHDIEADGASAVAVSIEAGYTFNFVGPEISNTVGVAQGSADTYALQILPDASHSVTQQITITGGRIGDSTENAALINAQSVTVTGTLFWGASQAGSASYPAIEIGASAKHVKMSGIIAGPTLTGSSALASYGVVIDSGATYAQVDGDLSGNVTGPYSIATTDPNSYVRATGGTSGIVDDFAQNVAGASVRRFYNLATGAGVAADHRFQTGTAGSRLDYGLADNNGSPYTHEYGNTANTTKYADFTAHYFRNLAGIATFLGITSSGVELGAAGTLVPLILHNNTSGTLTLNPVTGALGTVTLLLPAVSDTLVARTTTDTLTNKTYDTAGTGNVLKVNGNQINAYTGTGGTVALSASPTFTGTITGPTFQSPASTNLNLYAASGQTLVLDVIGSTGLYVTSTPSLQPTADNSLALGANGERFASVYGTTYYGGANVAGVSCGGSPTSSFASAGGIVTHC